jgi:hypothetical protein
MEESKGGRLARAQIALAVLLILGTGALLGHAVLRSPDVPFVFSGATPWIWPPIAPAIPGLWLDRDHPRVCVFERHFLVDRTDGPVTLRVRALRDLDLRVNGHEVPLPGRDPQRWKEASVVEIGPLLVTG